MSYNWTPSRIAWWHCWHEPCWCTDDDTGERYHNPTACPLVRDIRNFEKELRKEFEAEASRGVQS